MKPSTYLLTAFSLAVFGGVVWSSCGGLGSIDKPADVAAAEANLPERIDYNLHVKPILSDRCFACHGPDKNKQQAGLRLDTPEGAYQALAESGKTAIKPGDLADSELAHRILSTDPDEVMPTPKSNLSLSAEEKAVLLRWVEQGAAYKPHWSLVAPTMPEVPQIDNDTWSKNDIDKFVQAKWRELATEGMVSQRRKLSHAPEADKLTLLRRVSLDLTGLPPTPAEVDAFMADKSANAYEKVVDRLLASPHYAEHQTAAWMDVARYADTHGYQLDVPRTAWPYRDWVIRSFNQNQPFDQFVTWQLAGDLLPPTDPVRTRDQLIATAFNRLHPQNQEGGIVEDEYRAEYAADRVGTFGKAFLGLTTECARCHDHKYDPISQKDYYQLFAFFDKVNEAGQVPFLGESSPTMLLTDPNTDKILRYIQTQIKAVETRANTDSRIRQQYEQWAQRQPAGGIQPNWRGLIARYAFDDTSRFVFANKARPHTPATVSGNRDLPPGIVVGRFGYGRYVNGEGHIDLGPSVAFFERHEPFTISLWVKRLKRTKRGPLFTRSNGLDNGNRGYECMLNEDGTLSFCLAHSYPDHAINLQTTGPLPLGRWLNLTITYDGSGKAAGTHLFFDGEQQPLRVNADQLHKSILQYSESQKTAFGLYLNFLIGGKFRDSMSDFLVDELNIFNRAITADEVRVLSRKIDRIEPSLTYFRSAVDTISARYREALSCWRQHERMANDSCPEVMVMREQAYPRQTYLLKRGAYDAPGEAVQAQTPHFLPQLDEDVPKNRLTLAQWLLSEEQPLFSRVMVNRIWQQYFGQGLAKNPDDFGNQGALPSHPELLDYLAVRFRDGWPLPGDGEAVRGWDVKALHRLIVTSATYRQSSSASENTRELDLDNTYLSRGASYRLSAEQVRDNALAASGLLVRTVGGPSVYPYQPTGVWESVSTTTYPQSHGDSLYRRTMYTFWRRTTPHPALINFDASERHMCTVKRQKTSTPLQALVTLNDPQYIEAARVLAQRAAEAGLMADEERMIDYLFKAVISRPARPVERQLMQQLFREELTGFRQHPQRAINLLSVGEYPVHSRAFIHQVAAWTVVANTVMNFDEAIMKR